MDRIVCENCGREYEGYLGSCPVCGHENEDFGFLTAKPVTNLTEDDVLGEFDVTVAQEDPPAPQTAPEAEAAEADDDTRHAVPTWVLGAACGALALIIVIGVILLINLSRKDRQSEESALVSQELNVTEEISTIPETPQAAAEKVDQESAASPESSQTQPDEQDEPEPEEADLTCQSLSLDLEDVTLQFCGETFTLKATVLPVALADQVEWTVSNENFLLVEDGVVTALGGSRSKVETITATCQDKTASCIIRFAYDDDPTVIQLGYSDVTLAKIGDTLKIPIQSGLTDEQRENVIWLTDNAGVAVVDENGNVTAMGRGSANITANLGNRVGTCIIRVS